MKSIFQKYKRKIFMFTTLFLIGMVYWAYYAFTADPGMAAYTVGYKTSKYKTHDLTNGLHDKCLSRVDEYAELSDIVYRDSVNENTVTCKDWVKLDIPMENILPNDPKRRVRARLYYELWKLDEEDKSTVAIVFKGTKDASDWYTNARWVWKIFNRSDWDHYDQLNKVLPNIVESITLHHTKNKPLKIVTTGHSLGGGLAQFAAYRHKDIDTVFAFDPSPVTGYYDVPKKDRIENRKNVLIYRMYESGEGLSYVRKFMTFLYPALFFKTEDPKLIRIRFSFLKVKGTFDQHSIGDLAKNLRKYKEGELNIK